VAALLLTALICPAACTGSPATLAQPADFAMKTSTGIASVSVRETLPSFTDDEFAQLVQSGMERAAPGALIQGRVPAPGPRLRIVWHTDPIATRGVSRLVVNVFNGTTPFTYEQAVVDNSAPPATVVRTIQSMTGRLAVFRADDDIALGFRAGRLRGCANDHPKAKT
jgi:hypothetical protein